jgi:hypothetical protein
MPYFFHDSLFVKHLYLCTLANCLPCHCDFIPMTGVLGHSYWMILHPCPRHPSPCQGYMSHGNTTAGLDLVSKWTLVIPFDLCHVGYREVPSMSVHQAMTWQISTCHKYLSNIMECSLRGMVMLSDVQNAMVSAQVMIHIQTFRDRDSMIMCCCD